MIKYLNPWFWLYMWYLWRGKVWSTRRDRQTDQEVAVVAEHNRLHPEDCRIYVPKMPFAVITGVCSYKILACNARYNVKQIKELVLEGNINCFVPVLPAPALKKKIIFGPPPDIKKTHKERLHDAAKKVADRLLAMSPEELKAEIEKHKDGDFAKILLESGAIDLMRKNEKADS